MIDRLNDALEGRYTIERELGQGGMATVYLAADLKHGRKVAIKVLKPELAAVIGGERFVAEIRTTAGLQHPHILPLFDSGEASGFLYYVMPYVEGETLRDRLDREKQLGVEEALAITRDVADALDYAHRQGVIHRDIKPENILLHDGRPVVADFGIAVAISAAGGGRMTETGLSLGTPHYMSPEQATADRDLTARSDVYSLACVLYEMLAGDPPHTGPTAQAVLVRILTETPRPVSDTRTSVPPHVAAVLTKALEKLPADRFDSAAEFKAALGRTDFTYTAVRRPSQVGEPSPAGSTGAPGTQPESGASGLPRFLPWAVAAAAILVAIFLALQNGRAAPDDGPAVRTVLAMTGVMLPPDAWFEVIISPDGSRFAVVGQVEQGEYQIYHRTAEDMAFRPIPGTQGDVWSLRFSPDGEWIAYVEDAGDRARLMKVSLLGGQPTPVVPVGDIEPRLLDWSVEGWIVFWANTPDGLGLFRVPDTGGTPERLIGEPEWRTFLYPQHLPDASGVLFSDAEGSVALYDFETDSVSVLIPQGIDARYIESGHILYLDQGGGLWGVPFDLATHRVTGDAKPLLQDLAFSDQEGRYSVSRTGTLVYGTGGVSGLSGAQSELVVVGLDGSTTVLDLPPRRMGVLQWAPDGRTVAYHGLSPGEEGNELDIYLYDTELENAPRRLTNVGNNRWPIWSPDGSRIALTSVRDGTDLGDLFIRNVLDDQPPRLILSLPEYQSVTDWPSADTLIVESGAPSGIFLLDLSGDSAVVTPYYTPDADVDDMVVSPDRRLAAYASDESGQDEIYMRSFPEPRAETVVSEGGGRLPVWSPDGSTLYYRCENNTSLCAAEIATEPTAVVRSRRVLMPWPAGAGVMDLHPDGDRFITERDAGTGDTDPADIEPERHIVIHNWFGELRRIFEGSGH